MNEWTGVLGRLEAPTADGKVLATPERLLSRPLPLPLFSIDGGPLGSINQLSIHGDEVRAEGTVRDGILTPEHPELPVGLDADQTEYEAFGQGLRFTHWRIVGATLYADATASGPWPEAVIRLKEDGRD